MSASQHPNSAQSGSFRPSTGLPGSRAAGEFTPGNNGGNNGNHGNNNRMGITGGFSNPPEIGAGNRKQGNQIDQDRMARTGGFSNSNDPMQRFQVPLKGGQGQGNASNGFQGGGSNSPGKKGQMSSTHHSTSNLRHASSRGNLSESSHYSTEKASSVHGKKRIDYSPWSPNRSPYGQGRSDKMRAYQTQPHLGHSQSQKQLYENEFCLPEPNWVQGAAGDNDNNNPSGSPKCATRIDSFGLLIRDSDGQPVNWAIPDTGAVRIGHKTVNIHNMGNTVNSYGSMQNNSGTKCKPNNMSQPRFGATNVGNTGGGRDLAFLRDNENSSMNNKSSRSNLGGYKEFNGDEDGYSQGGNDNDNNYTDPKDLVKTKLKITFPLDSGAGTFSENTAEIELSGDVTVGKIRKFVSEYGYKFFENIRRRDNLFHAQRGYLNTPSIKSFLKFKFNVTV